MPDPTPSSEPEDTIPKSDDFNTEFKEIISEIKGLFEVRQNYNKDQNNSRELYLSELKMNFERQFEGTKAQDTKIEKMITVSSAIATLLIGLGTFLVTRLDPEVWIYYVVVGVLLIGIILAISSIALFINSFKIRYFSYPFSIANLFPNLMVSDKKIILKIKNPKDKDIFHENSVYMEDVKEYYVKSNAEKLWKRPKTIFLEQAIQTYATSIRINQEVIDSKAKQIQYGQWVFFGSILSVTAVLFITLAGIASGVPFIESVEEIVNHPPTSSAGVDILAIENDTITLNGSKSYDLEDELVSLKWDQTAGPKVYLYNDTNAIASFIAPNVINATELKFKLIVRDVENATSEDEVKVIVKNDISQHTSNPLICDRITPNPVSNTILATNLFKQVSNHTINNELSDDMIDCWFMKTKSEKSLDNLIPF